MPRREGSGRRLVDRELVAGLLRDGWSPRDAANRLQISERTVLRIRHETGLPVEPRVERRTVTDEDLAIIERCLNDKMPLSEITATYRYTHQTITRYFPGHGLSRSEVAELAAAARAANRALRKNRTLISC